MYTLSKLSPLKIAEARIVYLHSGNSLKSSFFLPNTEATTARRSSSSRREDPLIYRRSTGGATVPERRPMSVANMTSSNVDSTDDRIPRISSTIRVIPDFPKPGNTPEFKSSSIFAYLEYMIELKIICLKKNFGQGSCFRI